MIIFQTLKKVGLLLNYFIQIMRFLIIFVCLKKIIHAVYRKFNKIYEDTNIPCKKGPLRSKL